MSKSDVDKSYDEGYEAGKKENIGDDILGALSKPIENIIPIPDNLSPKQKAYEGGLKDGSKDRYDDKNSHYQGGAYNEKKEKRSYYQPPEKPVYNRNNYQAPADDNAWIGSLIKLGVIIAVIVGIIWVVFKLVLPLIIIDIAIIALVVSFLKDDWRNGLRIASIIGGAYLIFDYNTGLLTQSLMQNVSFSYGAIQFIFYLNMAAGLVSLYFLVRDLFENNSPTNGEHTEFSKRNMIIMGCLALLAATLIFFQEFYHNLSFSQPAVAAEYVAPATISAVPNGQETKDVVVQPSNVQDNSNSSEYIANQTVVLSPEGYTVRMERYMDMKLEIEGGGYTVHISDLDGLNEQIYTESTLKDMKLKGGHKYVFYGKEGESSKITYSLLPHEDKPIRHPRTLTNRVTVTSAGFSPERFEDENFRYSIDRDNVEVYISDLDGSNEHLYAADQRGHILPTPHKYRFVAKPGTTSVVSYTITPAH